MLTLASGLVEPHDQIYLYDQQHTQYPQYCLIFFIVIMIKYFIFIMIYHYYYRHHHHHHHYFVIFTHTHNYILLYSCYINHNLLTDTCNVIILLIC